MSVPVNIHKEREVADMTNKELKQQITDALEGINDQKALRIILQFILGIKDKLIR